MQRSKWLDLAVKVAEASPYDKWRVGAVIVRGGSVQAVGVSKLKNDPIVAGHHELCSVHAEADALSRCANPKGARVYVARLTPGGRVGLARPCGRCWDLLWDAGVKDIRWTK